METGRTTCTRETSQQGMAELKHDEKGITTEVRHGVGYQSLTRVGQAPTWVSPRWIKRVSTVLHYNGKLPKKGIRT